jgi:hypothetical protein
VGLERNLGRRAPSDLRHRNGDFRICLHPRRRLRCAALHDGARLKAYMPCRKVRDVRRHEFAQVEVALVVEQPAQQALGTVSRGSSNS